MDYNLIILIFLVLLATGDLIVGVANDAVNFLNSAIGSKAAPFKIIMFVAAMGMLAGVTFSSGMMEIARKGIVNPQYFLLGEILIIFIAYALSDVIVLDFYNTFGLPTSTTVSMIFGIFGGAVAITLIKISEGVYEFANFGTYLNVDNIFKFVTAILISIILSFILGSLVQYLSRLLFSFDFVNRFKKYGSIWAGLVLTSIFYFILLKGVGGSSFATEEMLHFIKHNQGLIILAMLGIFTVIVQLFLWFTNVNVLKIIVLIGTFSLAMAFAANDLVNFIGVPLAAISAYQYAVQFPDPNVVELTELTKPFVANNFILLSAGVVMIATLYLSKKSRSVSKTEVSLGSQEEAVERFDTFMLARGIVRSFIGFVNILKKVTPKSTQKFVKSRFDRTKLQIKYPKGEAPAFDLIRAAVNLMVASALISLGTSLKLPLSTTYVTFIVAMSTALADRAWGRESAVYRVSGVLTVIGGWFITALVATTVAGMIATAIYYGGMFAIIGLFILSFFLILRTNLIHKKREKEFEEKEKLMSAKGEQQENANTEMVFNNTATLYATAKSSIHQLYDGITNENLKKLKKAKNSHKKIKEITENLTDNIVKLIKSNDNDINKNGNLIAKSIGALDRIHENYKEISNNIFKYFDNNHEGFDKDKNKDLNDIKNYLDSILGTLSDCFANLDFQNLEETNRKVDALSAKIRKYQQENINEIAESEDKLRLRLLYLNILNYTQVILDDILVVTKTVALIYDSFENKKLKK